jgi:exportin-2 (importin alpha re-exporter)
LSEIISTIALQDYPENWPDLVDRLLERISPNDFATNLTILKTCHYVFKRYRLEERSDDLYLEINYTIAKFGPAMFQIYVGIEGVLKAPSTDKQQLSAIVQNAIYVNKIFYSLSYQDIPEFIEENLATFMRILMLLFTFDLPLLRDSNEDQPGLLEKLSSSVAKIVILYASKYEEDFTSLTDFAQATWNILTTRVSTAPKDDKLACTCIGFLASVARQERHKGIFESTLQIICDKIILPNMTIRESDLEIFEDEPIEYIKRDTENSSDVSTRNSSAVLLVRNLMEFFELEMTNNLFAAVSQSLSDYYVNPTRNWRSKLLATQLFSAIGARGFTEAFGVTRVNSLLKLSDFFSLNVLADLQPSNEGLHPLIKLEAIKFVTHYRNQLEKGDLSRALPLLLHHLESKNYIIHTYAALAIERILAVKRGGETFLSSADLSVIVGKILVTILALIFNHRTVDKMCENYFLIKGNLKIL